MQHMQYVHLILFINNYYSSLVAYYVYISHVHAGLHTGFFYGGGTHISAASRGSGENFLYSTLDFDLILGGTQAGGGKSQCAPPPPLYATLACHNAFTQCLHSTIFSLSLCTCSVIGHFCVMFDMGSLLYSQGIAIAVVYNRCFFT